MKLSDPIKLPTAAFNLLNHPNATGIDPIETSSSFGQVTSVAPPRRIQLGMRLEF